MSEQGARTVSGRAVHQGPDVRHCRPGGPDPATISRLRLVIARRYRQLTQAFSRHDLTSAQLSALARTEEHGPLRSGQLAALERVAPPSMTRTIAPLAGGGLIRREADPCDGRSSLVTITPAGREVLARLRGERCEMLARRARRLDPEQWETL